MEIHGIHIYGQGLSWLKLVMDSVNLGKAPGMLRALLQCSSNSPIPREHGGSDRKTQEDIRVHRLP